jgi:hydroxymethylpyrimidine pyrophosphatase-like HAD family hydrolase
MRFTILATDYDGTLATNGIVADAIVEHLRRAREKGLRLVLVTGRELPSLFDTFAHVDLFELVVAENGAVLYDPATRSTAVIAPPPQPGLLAALQRERVPISVGHSIVATTAPYDLQMRAAIQAFAPDSHIIYNKRAVMALPLRVTKATGLIAALAILKVTPQQCIGIGDAENDVEFMRLCGLAVAVCNALPQVKFVADIVLASERGAGVIELATRLLAGEFETVAERR